MTLACPRSLLVTISGQCVRTSDPGTAPTPALQLLVQVLGQERERLKNQPVHVGEKDVLWVWRLNKGKNGQFFNIYWLNPAQSLHGAQLYAIKVKSQHGSTAEPCREKCSCMASTNPVVNVRVKAQSSGLSQVFPGLWAWSLPLCCGRRSSGEQLLQGEMECFTPPPISVGFKPCC